MSLKAGSKAPDFEVKNQHGEIMALFRGKSAQIPGTVVNP